MSDKPILNLVFVHPDYEKLKTETEKLRTELSMLLFEHDSLVHQECLNIEAKYMVVIGALEYKLLEFETELLRLKRKAELIQAKINRQEEVNLNEIEDCLAAEYAEYTRLLNERLHTMNKAIERSMFSPVTEQDLRDMKKCYREIIKALHPDMHTDADPEMLKLFHSAVQAYENGNVDALRAIHALIDNPIINAEEESGLSELKNEKERLNALIERVNKDIADVKSRYPYTMKALLENPEQVKARKAEIEESLVRLKEACNMYTLRIEEMTGC